MLVSEAKDLFREYEAEVEAGRISPILFIQGTYPYIPQQDHVLIDRDGDRFRGILHYSIFQVDNPDALEALLFSEFEDKLVDERERQVDSAPPGKFKIFRSHDYGKPIVRIQTIESFEPGCGTRLIDNVQQLTDADTLFVTPTPSAGGFYRRIGFENTGLYRFCVQVPILARH
ncbi:hypothetical protein KY329_04065 [Candidatus Woesearchaeota archaeon]|nr:hypothetical protein [Candidatus Woesearchaeota archaeon]